MDSSASVENILAEAASAAGMWPSARPVLRGHRDALPDPARRVAIETRRFGNVVAVDTHLDSAAIERRARQPSRRVVRAAAPGASYFVLVFDRTQLPEGSLPGPAHPVTDNELRDVVAPYRVVDDIRLARLHGNLPPDFEGFPGIELRDEPKGRKSIAAWLLSAHRE